MYKLLAIVVSSFVFGWTINGWRIESNQVEPLQDKLKGYENTITLMNKEYEELQATSISNARTVARLQYNIERYKSTSSELRGCLDLLSEGSGLLEEGITVHRTTK